ncbi:elongation of very long chain fatty acids protein, partial [Nephila pilipes]
FLKHQGTLSCASLRLLWPLDIDRLRVLLHQTCSMCGMENSKTTLFKTGFNWRCQSIDWSEKQESINTIRIGWILLIVKLLELLDTIFLRLRKEDSEVSPRHLYLQLHSPLLVWYGLKFAPGNLLKMLNSCTDQNPLKYFSFKTLAQ